MELLCTKVTSKVFRPVNVKNPKLLVYGSCIPQEFPEIFKQYSEGKECFDACLEHVHFNDVIEKLSAILKFNKIEELTVLTIDGSPHCIQLHFAAQDAKRITGADTQLKHFAIEKGKVIEASADKVKAKRHLHM